MTTDTADNIPDEFPQASEPTAEGGSRTRRDLILWLALLPVILGLLVLCGQVAMMISLGQSPANTQSLLRASYTAWVNELIPPINIPQLIEDIQDDLRAEGIVEEPLPVVTGSFWVPPTPTETATPPGGFATATLAPSADTPTAASEATNTRAPSSTASLIPSATKTATPSPSATNTWAPLFTATNEPQEPTSTRAPTLTSTAVPSATRRPPTVTATLKPPPTLTSTATKAPAATNTPETPPPYIHVIPIAELSERNPNGDGCIAYFGYDNKNPGPVSIPLGAGVNELTVEHSVSLPTTFDQGSHAGVFSVVWNSSSGEGVTWILDGGSSTAAWCNP